MRAFTTRFGVDAPQAHADQVENADARARDERSDVQADELEDQCEDHQQDDDDEDQNSPEDWIFHGDVPSG
jgi:hypothetical protein